MFNPEKFNPLKIDIRGGNTDLEFNMNSHIRNFAQIFIVQTEPNGATSARQLNFDPEGSSGYEEDRPVGFPPIVFTNAKRGYAKDCWLIKIEGEDGSDENEQYGMKFYVQTICKSSTDEYLNADCLYPTLPEKSKDGEEKEKSKMKTLQYSTKIKAQEIYLSYPCLVSNIGLSRIMI
jgi:hypothetical protein